MLVHICCSVDSHFFLQELQKLYPDERLIGFFYDPNIHPYGEYELRLFDVKRSCEKLGIELIEGEYDYRGWLDAVSGLEDEPEKGARCSVCFDNRLERSAQKALEIGEKTLTTTLLTSPKKSIEQLRNSANEIANRYGVRIVTPDFRKNGGTARQFALARRDMLYHQNYCGCMFALKKQRESQKRFEDELSAPVNGQILPSSIEDRKELYKKVYDLERKGAAFKLRREKFLNYRLLRAFLKRDKEVIPSYPLFYSYSKRNYIKGKIEFIKDDIGFLNRDEVLLVGIKYLKGVRKSVKELMRNPLSVEEEISLREEITGSKFNLSPIIIIDDLEYEKYEIHLNSKIYDDVRENLVIFR